MFYSVFTRHFQVGFIGLGAMGARMADNLRRSGLDLVVHDTSISTLESFCKNEGVESASSPAAVASQEGIISSNRKPEIQVPNKRQSLTSKFYQLCRCYSNHHHAAIMQPCHERVLRSRRHSVCRRSFLPTKSAVIFHVVMFANVLIAVKRLIASLYEACSMWQEGPGHHC